MGSWGAGGGEVPTSPVSWGAKRPLSSGVEKLCGAAALRFLYP